jgi:glycine cleavage system aminomethyltransferase T
VSSSLDNPEAGYDALSTGVAILDRSHMGRVMATGGDALDLINRFSTNETVGLSDGDVVVTVLTSQIGRVLELITIARLSATESILLTGPDAEDTVIEWLDPLQLR